MGTSSSSYMDGLTLEEREKQKAYRRAEYARKRHAEARRFVTTRSPSETEKAMEWDKRSSAPEIDLPDWHLPKQRECDAIVSGRTVTIPSQDNRRFESAHAVTAAAQTIHKLMTSGEMPFRSRIQIGVDGFAAGPIHLGTSYDANHPALIKISGLEIDIVGVGAERAKVGPFMLGDRYHPVSHLGLHHVIVRAAKNMFCMMSDGAFGTLSMRDWGFEMATDTNGQLLIPSSAMHFGDGYRGIYIGGYRRLETNGVLFRAMQHSGPYLKGGGDVFLIGNDCSGGNRTWSQIRPQLYPEESYPQYGSVLVEGNKADGFGYDFPDTPEWNAGGGIITVWSTPFAPVVFRKNEFTDCRYAGLVAGFQPEENGNIIIPGTEDNPLTHLNLHLEDNVITSHRGDRPVVEINATLETHFWGTNRFEAPDPMPALALGSHAGHVWGAGENDNVVLHVSTPEQVDLYEAARIAQYDPSRLDLVPMEDWKSLLQRTA